MRVAQVLTQGRKRRSINWSQSKLIFDGNSLFASHPTTASQRVPQRVLAAAPVNGAAAFAMLAIGGQTTQQMIDSAADVDAAIDPTKLNILLAWEGTNGMIDGAELQAQRMKAYLAARKAAAVAKGAEMLMIVAGTIPRHEVTSISIAERNDRMVAYNKILAANWRTWGCSAYVDTRPPGGPFDLPDWSTASFTRAETLPMWSPDDAAGTYTHLSVLGALYIQALFSAALRRL